MRKAPQKLDLFV